MKWTSDFSSLFSSEILQMHCGERREQTFGRTGMIFCFIFVSAFTPGFPETSHGFIQRVIHENNLWITQRITSA